VASAGAKGAKVLSGRKTLTDVSKDIDRPWPDRGQVKCAGKRWWCQEAFDQRR
jgi:hypothetical protein